YALIAEAAREVLGPEAIGHAGGDETSVILAIRPELVDGSMLGPRTVDPDIQRVQETLRTARGSLPVAYRRLTASGATGDSSHASATAGSAIIGQATSRLRHIAQDIMSLDIASFRAS
ncbi:MAG TPA: creatininase family protein, partial [Thermomicrobiales bacterium]|nr:creatininase family protein [Thermomicrobiales bacterium]